MRNAYRKLDAAQARATWAREITEDPVAFIEEHSKDPTSHAFACHVNASDEQLLESVLSGQKHGDTRFTDERTAYACISDAIFQYMSQIHEFAETADDGDKLLLQADAATDEDDRPRMVGHGFLSTAKYKDDNVLHGNVVRKVQTNVTGLIIKKRSDRLDKWIIESAFPMSRPDLSRKDAVLDVVREDFSKVLESTPTYRKASPVEQVYMDLTCAGKPFGTGSMRLALAPETIPEKRGPGPHLVLYRNRDPSDTKYDYHVDAGDKLDGRARFRIRGTYLEKPFASSYECGRIQTPSQDKLLPANAARVAKLIEQKLSRTQMERQLAKDVARRPAERPERKAPMEARRPPTRRLPDTSSIEPRGKDGYQPV